MKTTKIIYWISTGIIALMMVFSTYAYLTMDKMAIAFQHLGYPAYFRVELAIAKFAGALLLVLPLGARAREWAYAGFAITFVSAAIAHISSGDPASIFVSPIIFLLVLGVSYFTFHKLNNLVPAINA